MAVFRPSDGSWHVLYSSNGGQITESFGTSGNIPVTGDYDGDGKTDYAVFRPSNATWYVLQSTTGEWLTEQFGTAGDFVVSGESPAHIDTFNSSETCNPSVPGDYGNRVAIGLRYL